MEAPNLNLLESRIIEAAQFDPLVFGCYCFEDDQGKSWKKYAVHKEWHDFLDVGDRHCLKAPIGTAKCELANARITLMNGGTCAIETITKKTRVVAVDPATMKMRSVMAGPVFDNGVQPAVGVRLRSGRMLCVTTNHPLYTVRGWTPAGLLRAGEYIAGARSIPATDGADPMTPDEAALAGFLVGDGGLTTNCAFFTKQDPDVCAEVARLCTAKGWKLNGYNDRGSHYLTQPGVVPGGLAGIQPWLRWLGLAHVGSAAKRVPKQVFDSGNPATARFIGAYFDCDGTVDKAAKGVSICSMSRGLLDDVQLLLLRFGIVSRVGGRAVTYKGDKIISWNLSVTGQENVDKFRACIPLCGPKRATLAAMPRAEKLSTVRDVVPNGWREQSSVPITPGLMDRGGAYCKTSGGNHRTVVRRVLAEAGDTAALHLASDAIHWDRIEEVTDLGEQQTYGLPVHDPCHCYLSSGMLSHNSQTVTISRNVWHLGRTPSLNIGIIANTADQGKERGAQIREIIESNPRVHKVFPKLRPGKKWTDAMLSVAERPAGQPGYSVRTYGTYGPVLQSRYRRLVCDDVCDFENTLTSAARDKLYSWFTSTVFGRMFEESVIDFVGTSWHPEDVLHRLPLPPPLGPGFPGRTYKIIMPDGSLLIPELWPQRRIDKARLEFGEFDFARQLMNEPRDDSTSRFRGEWIEGALKHGTEGVQLERPEGLRQDGAIVLCGVDFGHKQSANSDLTVFAVVGVYPNRHRRVLSIESGRFQAPELVEKFKSITRRYDPIFYVEDNGAQDMVLGVARWLSGSGKLKSHHTAGGRKSLPALIEKLAFEFEQGVWTLPSHRVSTGDRDGTVIKAANRDIEQLGKDMLYWLPGAHVPDRLAALCFVCGHAPWQPYAPPVADTFDDMRGPTMYVPGGPFRSRPRGTKHNDIVDYHGILTNRGGGR